MLAARAFLLLWWMSRPARGQCYGSLFGMGGNSTTRCSYSYRLRLVSISCDPAYDFSIDRHQLTVIEADGNNVRPVTVDSLQIFAGAEVESDSHLIV